MSLWSKLLTTWFQKVRNNFIYTQLLILVKEILITKNKSLPNIHYASSSASLARCSLIGGGFSDFQNGFTKLNPRVRLWRERISLLKFNTQNLMRIFYLMMPLIDTMHFQVFLPMISTTDIVIPNLGDRTSLVLKSLIFRFSLSDSVYIMCCGYWEPDNGCAGVGHGRNKTKRRPRS